MISFSKRKEHPFSETCERDGASTRNFLARKYPCYENGCSFRFVQGFTLLELMISLAIFTFMTAFLLAKYGTFNQSVILTDLAYDTAITVRDAQASALNTTGASSTSNGLVFNNVYGVHFIASPNTADNTFIYFVNPSTICFPSSPCANPPSATYVTTGSSPSQIIGTYTMKAGDSVSAICVQVAGVCTAVPYLDVSFQRPNPDATISASVSGGATSTYPYADITIMGNDGSTRDIIIQGTGEISVSH